MWEIQSVLLDKVGHWVKEKEKGCVIVTVAEMYELYVQSTVLST